MADSDASRARDEAPTNVRYAVLLAATLAAAILYLDRVCIAEVLKYEEVRESLRLSDSDVDWSYFAFFIAYALMQVPAGWLSDRFGGRAMMAIYIVAWSALTAFTGWASGFVVLFLLRLGVGVAQAGAYPTCGSLLSRWMPLEMRAFGSSIVSFGGRVGGAVAPYLTSGLIAALAMEFQGAEQDAAPQPWRMVMALYGAIGLAVAAWFWLVVREQPDQHPRSNLGERKLVAHGRRIAGNSDGRRERFPAKALLASGSMWLMCISQFTTNFGWTFLITKMPAYLKDVRRAQDLEGGAMATVVLLVGMAGMLLGGRLTDWTTARLGLRWGRTILLIGSRFIAMAAFLAVAPAPTAWAAAACFALVAFSTDLGVAGTWACMQDVGGKHVGATLGWGNMWGNFGSALSAPLLGWIGKRFDADGDWSELFLVCALSFLISGLVSLGIDATKPIVPDEPSG